MIGGNRWSYHCAEILKQHYPNLKVFAVEPEASPVISGGAPGPHPLQGIGAGFIPTNLYTELLDGAIQVSRSIRLYSRRAQRGRMLVGILPVLPAAVAKNFLKF
jgi:cysteine synthase A